MIVDLFLVYQFIRRLATPFEKWPAYEAGVIDKDGNIIKGKKERNTRSENDSFGIFDLMILKLKRLLAKVPGGSSKLASYAAALWLIREWQHFSKDSLLNESVSEDLLDESIDLFFSRYCYYIQLEEDVNINIKSELEEEPTNSVGSGNIAGMDGTAFSKAAQNKWTSQNKSSKKKRLRDIIGAKI